MKQQTILTDGKFKNNIGKDANRAPMVYRQGSAYQKILSILWDHRQITRDQLAKRAMRVLKKNETHTRYDISIVTSVRRNDDGTFTSHRSAQNAIDYYYCNVSAGGAIELVEKVKQSGA